MGTNTASILFLGLDSAGKTSFILTLENKFSKLQSLKPTMGLNRTTFNIMGFTIITFDIGGQLTYRKTYLEDEKLAMNADLVFYIMDVQERNRYAENAEFFEQIINKIDENKFPTEIIVCLHKADPDLVQDEDSHIHANINIATRLMRSKAKNHDIKFFNTSIFDYSSLILAFSAGVLKIIKDSTKIMETFFQDFIEKVELDGICLLDQDALIIYEITKGSESILQTLEIIGPKLSYLSENLLRYDFEYPKTIDIMMGGWSFFRSFEVNKKRFYLVTYSQKVKDFNDLYKKLDDFTIATKDFMTNLLK